MPNEFNLQVGVVFDPKQTEAEILKLQMLVNKTMKESKLDIGTKEINESFKKLQKENEKLKKGFKETKEKSDKVNKSLGTMAKKAVGVVGKFALWTAVSGIIFGVISALKEAIVNMVNLELAFANLFVVSEATDEQLDKVDKRASELSKTLGVLKKDIIDITTEFARAGFTIKESLELAKSATLGANVGFTTVNKSAEILIATLKAFSFEATESARITDVLFNVSRNAAITYEGLGDALLRSANALRNTGVELEEAVALIATANETIQDPAKVGTALKTISARFKKITKEGGVLSAKLQSTFQDIGIEILDATGAFKDLEVIFGELVVASERYGGTQEFNFALQELAGTRQRNIVEGLITSWDTYSKTLNAGLESTGTAIDAQNVVLETTAKKITLLGNAWREFIDAVGETEGFKEFLDATTELLNKLTSFTKETEDAIAPRTQFLEDAKKFAEEVVKAKEKEIEENKKIIDGLEQNGVIAKENVDEYNKAVDAIKELKKETSEFRALLRGGGQKDIVFLEKIREDVEKFADEQAKATKANEKQIRELTKAHQELANARKQTNEVEKESQKQAIVSRGLYDELTESIQDNIDNFEFLSDADKKFTLQKLKNDIEMLESQKFLLEAQLDMQKAIDDTTDSLINQLIATGAIEDVLGTAFEQGLTAGEIEESINNTIFNINKLKGTISDLTDTNNDNLDTSEQQDKILKELAFNIDLYEKQLKRLDKDSQEFSDTQALISEQYKLQEERLLELIKGVKVGSEEYMDYMLALEDTRNAMFDLNQEIARSDIEAINQQIEKATKTVERLADALKKQYDKELDDFKKLQEDKISALEDSIDERRRLFAKEDFIKDEEKLTSEIEKLQDEKNLREIEGSLSAKSRIFEIDEELAEKQEALDELRLDRKRDLEIQGLEDEIDLIRDSVDEKEKEIDKKLELDSLYYEAKNLLAMSEEENIMNDIIDLLGTFDEDFVKDAELKGKLWVDEFRSQISDLSGVDTGGGAGGGQPRGSTVALDPKNQALVDNLINFMNQNRAKWGDASPENREALHQQNLDIAEDIGILTGSSPIYDPATGKWDIFKYANGGMADFTGLAQLDGTRQNPEAVLNPMDTKIFRNDIPVIASALKNFMLDGNGMGDSPVELNIAEINVNAGDDVDIKNIGRNIAKGVQTQFNKTGLRLNG